MLGLISLIAVAVLVLRKKKTPLGTRLIWTVAALAAFFAPTALLVIVDAVAPRWPMRPILTPFIAVSEFAAPWIVFAIFNDRTESYNTSANDS